MLTSRSRSLFHASSLALLAAGLLAHPVLAQPSLSISGTSITEGNAGSVQAVVTVTLAPAASAVVTVRYESSPAIPAATGGADCDDVDVDFVDFADTLQFDPGDVSKTISVSVCGDTVQEPDEKFRVRLFGASGATIATSQGPVTILDDDDQPPPPPPPPLPSVSIDDMSFPEGDAGITARNATVRLSATTSQTVTVDISILPGGTATGGFCGVSGVDVQLLPLTASINPGQNDVTVGIGFCGDTTFEPDETFSVALSNPSGATLGDAAGQVTIANDDEEPITVSVRDTTILEGDLGTLEGEYTLTLSRAAEGTVRVALVVQGGTATFGSGCTGAADFRSVVGGTVEFSAGQTSRRLSFAICSDLNVEPNETFSVTLARPSGAVLGDAVGQITIQNDDFLSTVVPREENLVVPLVPALAQLNVDIEGTRTQLGPTVGYNLTVRNTGLAAASGVVVRIRFPFGVDFGGLGNAFGTCVSDVASGPERVDCTLPPIPAGGGRVGTIFAEVGSTYADSSRLEFSAEVDPSNGVAEGDETDNVDSFQMTVRMGSDLQPVSGEFRKLGANLDGSFCLALCPRTLVSLLVTVRNNGSSGRSSATTLSVNWPGGISQLPNECLPQTPDALLCTAPAFDSAAVPSVYPGKTVEVGVLGLMQAPRGRGTVPVTVIVDPSGTTLDGVLSNNRLTLLLPVP